MDLVIHAINPLDIIIGEAGTPRCETIEINWVELGEGRGLLWVAIKDDMISGGLIEIPPISALVSISESWRSIRSSFSFLSMGEIVIFFGMKALDELSLLG